MTLIKLTSMLAKMEGRKHQASIGDVRELIKCLCALEAGLRIKGYENKNDAFLFDEKSEMFVALEAQVQKNIARYLKKKKK